MNPLGLPIFTFLFTRDEDVLESARVAAATKAAAWTMVNISMGASQQPAGAIVTVSGRADIDAPRFLSVIRRADRAQLVNSDGTIAA